MLEVECWWLDVWGLMLDVRGDLLLRCMQCSWRRRQVFGAKSVSDKRSRCFPLTNKPAGFCWASLPLHQLKLLRCAATAENSVLVLTHCQYTTKPTGSLGPLAVAASWSFAAVFFWVLVRVLQWLCCFVQPHKGSIVRRLYKCYSEAVSEDKWAEGKLFWLHWFKSFWLLSFFLSHKPSF